MKEEDWERRREGFWVGGRGGKDGGEKVDSRDFNFMSAESLGDRLSLSSKLACFRHLAFLKLSGKAFDDGTKAELLKRDSNPFWSRGENFWIFKYKKDGLEEGEEINLAFGFCLLL